MIRVAEVISPRLDGHREALAFSHRAVEVAMDSNHIAHDHVYTSSTDRRRNPMPDGPPCLCAHTRCEAGGRVTLVVVPPEHLVRKGPAEVQSGPSRKRAHVRLDAAPPVEVEMVNRVGVAVVVVVGRTSLDGIHLQDPPETRRVYALAHQDHARRWRCLAPVLAEPAVARG